MFIIYGAKPKYKEDLWAGKSVCPNCGKECDFHLGKLLIYITFFFIPTIPIVAKRLLTCDGCNHQTVLTGKQYKNARKNQLKLLNNNEFPKDIIKYDFHPRELDIGMQIIKLIFSAIIAFMGCLAIFPIIPFIISLKNLIFKLKCKKLYDSLYTENTTDSYEKNYQ